MAVKEQIPKYTQEEYLTLERKATGKSEFFQGDIFAMSGTSRQHNDITINLLTFLRQQLKGKPCKPYGSDMRIHIPSNTLYTYPDISAVCGEMKFLDGELDTLLNPVFIVEVLSRSTADYDAGGKFTLYRSIPTFMEYWLISSWEYRLQKFVRQADDTWIFSETVQPTDWVNLESLGLSLSVSEIYDEVQF